MCSFHSPTLDRPSWQCGQVTDEEGNASESLLLLPFSGLCWGCCNASAWSVNGWREREAKTRLVVLAKETLGSVLS